MVKMATIFMNKWVKEQRLDAQQVIHMHDEVVWQVRPEDSDALTVICHKAWKIAGEYFNLNIPIQGDVLVGKNWSECH